MSRPSQMPSSASASARQSTMSMGPAMGSSGQARLQAKRQELEGLLMLKEQSARLAKDVERLSQGVDQLVDGGEAVANVMASWAGVFRAVQIARAPPLEEGDQELEAESVRAIPETMVRLPVQTTTTESPATNQSADAQGR